MDTKKTLYLAGAFTAAVSFANTASAKTEMEKCYGAALAGKNGCANKSGTHSCAGQATEHCSSDEWKSVPVGTCEEAKAQCRKEAGLN